MTDMTPPDSHAPDAIPGPAGAQSRPHGEDSASAATVFSVPAGDPTLPLERIWPPAGLRIESPRLVLRLMLDADLPAYLAAATSPIQHTEKNPFARPWNEGSPEDKARTSLSWLWQARTRMDQKDMVLLLGVFLKEEGGGQRLIGCQDVIARDFAVLRTVSTGSWLTGEQQGRGLGREMRAAALLWAFDHLGARTATSGAYSWNRASRRVSAALGYRENGSVPITDAHGQTREEEIQYRLEAEQLVRPDWDVEVTGHAAFAAFTNLPTC